MSILCEPCEVPSTPCISCARPCCTHAACGTPQTEDNHPPGAILAWAMRPSRLYSASADAATASHSSAEADGSWSRVPCPACLDDSARASPLHCAECAPKNAHRSTSMTKDSMSRSVGSQHGVTGYTQGFQTVKCHRSVAELLQPGCMHVWRALAG